MPLTYRAVIQADRPLIEKWIAEDPYHAGKMTADSIINPPRGMLSFVACDEQGPIIFTRVSSAVRIGAQFGNDRKRTAAAIPEYFEYLRACARDCQMSELIFESDSEPLIKFCTVKLGFVASPNELRKEV